MIKINRQIDYAILIILITIVAVMYLLTAGSLGAQYGTIYQLSRCLLFSFLVYSLGKSLSGRVLALDLLMCVMTLWNIFSSYINGYLTFISFIDICVWPMVFIAAKNLAHTYPLSRSLTNLIYVCAAVVLACSVPNILLHYTGNDFAGYAVGAVYSAVMLLPMLFTLENSKTRNVFIALVFLCGVFTTKRTAFVALAIAVVGYLLLEAKLSPQREKAWKYIRGVLIIIVVAVAALAVINAYNLNILDRLSAVEEDGGSGRDEIWESIIQGFNSSTTTKKLLGHGHHSVAALRGRGQLAHNDYLEILYDYGIVGLAITSIFVLSLLRKFVKLYTLRSHCVKPYFIGIAFFAMFSIFSYMMDQSLRILYLMLFFGYMNDTEYVEIERRRIGTNQRNIINKKF